MLFNVCTAVVGQSGQWGTGAVHWWGQRSLPRPARGARSGVSSALARETTARRRARAERREAWKNIFESLAEKRIIAVCIRRGPKVTRQPSFVSAIQTPDRVVYIDSLSRAAQRSAARISARRTLSTRTSWPVHRGKDWRMASCHGSGLLCGAARGVRIAGSAVRANL